MAVQIQYRRGEASEWTAVNPTLALGEPGFETDTGKIKIGTGSLAWNDLVYTAGNSLFSGEGAPDVSLGRVGDFYIDTVSNSIYGPKTDTLGDEWGSPTNLQVVSINDLGDVDTSTTPPQARDALVWDDLNSVWKPGPAGAEASGSAGQIQYNDGASPVPGLAASEDLAWDDTAKKLSIGGDINLDDGGLFTTIVQMVTPTDNRTISFPDRTGTIALVAGSSSQVTYNSAGFNAGDSGLLYNATTGSLTVGGKTVSTNAPVLNLSQTWNSAGTTFTGLKLNVTNDASQNGSSTIDLSISGNSYFKHGYDFANNANTVTLDSPNLIHINSNDGTIVSFYGANNSSQPLNVRTAAGIGLGPLGAQTFLRSDEEHTLALKWFANSQTFRLYNTTDQPNLNYERTSITRNSTGLVIDAQKGGTGVDPTNLLDLQLNGSSTFKFDGANRRFYLGGNDYAYLDVSSDGYVVSLTNRYAGSGFAFKTDLVIKNITSGILLGGDTYAPGIRLGTFDSPPAQVTFSLNAGNVTSTMWLFGKHGGVYPASTGYTNGTGVSVWCGYGAQPTDANANGGNAGNFDVWLNAGGAGAGTGVAGANGRLRVMNDDTDTEVFGVEQSGVVQIGGERLIADLPSSPTAGMITRVTDGDSGLTFGNIVVNSGAGATPYLVWYNGTNWTVLGA